MVRDLAGKHPLYFEAILQLRNVSLEAVSYAEEKINSSGMRVVKLVEFKNGKDYYLTDKSLTVDIGRKMKEKFGGEFQVTAKIHTRIKDKDIYRLTVLFRGVSFQKGEKVIYQGEECQVLRLGKDFLLQNVLTKKKIHLRPKEMAFVKKKE